MSESTVVGAARKPNLNDAEGAQGAASEKRTDQGPFSTPERAWRTKKMMMLIGASVCIFILMVLVKIGGT